MFSRRRSGARVHVPHERLTRALTCARGAAGAAHSIFPHNPVRRNLTSCYISPEPITPLLDLDSSSPNNLFGALELATAVECINPAVVNLDYFEIDALRNPFSSHLRVS